MNEKNIEQLKARLVQLGFDASVEIELRCRICFSPDGFELMHIETSGKDVVRFAVKVERSERELYGLVFYHASLRKEIIVPAEHFAMDERMAGIYWKGMVGTHFEKIDKASVSNAFDLLQEMNSLGSGCDVLKFKHWVDTPLETLIPNLSALKSIYEITERFYLIDPTLSISFSDANRFLYSKWMEKQLVANKKLLVKKSESPKSAGVGNGKLLTKNSRRSGRQGLLKK